MQRGESMVFILILLAFSWAPILFSGYGGVLESMKTGLLIHLFIPTMAFKVCCVFTWTIVSNFEYWFTTFFVVSLFPRINLIRYITK